MELGIYRLTYGQVSKNLSYYVRGVDLKYPEFDISHADEFIRGDLRDLSFVKATQVFKGEGINFFEKVTKNQEDLFDEIYQFAADMGGAGYIFTGENDADIMHNSATINLNVLECMREHNQTFDCNKTKVFYSGSACMYPEHNQLDPDNPDCREESAYPANPDSEYGWEKLFSERLFLSYSRNILFQFVFQDITIYLVRRHLGGRKRKSSCGNLSGKFCCLKRAVKLKYGEMVNRLDPSCILTNALMQLID